MKERLIGFIKTYCLFVGIFALQKPLFMLLHFGLYKDCSPGEWLAAMWYGLPLDLSLAGYLTAIPGLFYICSVWKLGNGLRRVWCAYFGLVSVLMSAIFVIDTALYEYWGFRLDTTPFFYFFSSPKDALASGSLWLVAGGMLGMAFYALVIYACFRSDLLRRRSLLRMKMPYRRLTVSFVLLLFVAALFIPIRGGFSVSTMNTGKVYFSTNQRLNHAAINPAFSLMESISKQTDFASQYRFMDAAEADSLFDGLLDPQARQMRQTGVQPAVEQTGDSLRTLLSTSRPDVLFIVLEGFSSHLMGTLGGQQGVAVCLDSLSREGVLFTNFYANSFRTDRGLVAILSGYPAQPTTSIMKYPRKTQSIPSIAGRLAEEGYRAEYYYGGDADFTNMRSYLKSSGFERIVCDKDFPLSQRLSKWGVPDDVTFTIGKSDWSRDWFFQHVPHNTDPEAEALPFYGVRSIGRATPYTIVFETDGKAEGQAVLRLAICGTGTRSIGVSVNGRKAGKIDGLQGDGVITRHGRQGIWYERDFRFDASLLEAGTNTLTLTVPEGPVNNGIIYDYIRLELDESGK